MQPKQQNERSWLDAVLRACLHNRVIVLSAAIGMALWGIAVSPFDWNIDWLERDPVPVDAIPDLGEISKSCSPNGRGVLRRMLRIRSAIR